ncbi:MAG: TolC family protein [Thermoanaerobaculia bacterium]
MILRTLPRLLCPILALAGASGAASAAELTLEQALEIARGNNRGLASARSRLSAQEAALRSAHAERWPSLDFSQRLTRIDPDTVARANSAATGLSLLIGFEIPPFVFEDGFRTQLDLAVPVWTSGGLSAAIAAEDDGLDARRADSEAAWRNVRGEVARRFFSAVSNRQVMTAADAGLDELPEVRAARSPKWCASAAACARRAAPSRKLRHGANCCDARPRSASPVCWTSSTPIPPWPTPRSPEPPPASICWRRSRLSSWCGRKPIRRTEE